ncbi:hypothetical protein FJZ48_04000 [Candidatus Uhrbacteria bacterium]|nr:hypothetical protein [Candidatus Uhrbacteria bacterium]
MPYAKRDGYRGASKGGKRFGGGASSWKRDDRRGDFSRPMMHSATCATCGTHCEVPFKPNGRKPVYCSNCFVKDGDSAPKRSYSDSSDRYSKPREDRGSSQIDSQLREIQSKLDAIIRALNV